MAVYTRNSGPTLIGLMARVEEASKQQSDLSSEIALVRATLARAVDYWDRALEGNGTVRDETKLACEQLVRDCARAVADIVHTAARARTLDQGAIQLSSVSWVVGEVTRAIEDVVRETHPEVAESLVERIGKIKLPEDGVLKQFISRVADEAFL